MSVIYVDNISHFELSVYFSQIRRLIVLGGVLLDFLLFEKMDHRNCIKFCAKKLNEMCKNIGNVDCGIWRVYYEQKTSSVVV